LLDVDQFQKKTVTCWADNGFFKVFYEVRPLSAPCLVAGNNAYDENKNNKADTGNGSNHAKPFFNFNNSLLFQ